ncbi:molybdopterin-dependent oxidoreductase [Nocardia carnea]|uniref:molybdopterin-dependent oxidoreductase n=1 Tax=Nocardia carnea TaxID=37328 RepID=UPI002458B2A8|nr:molybdopterin-dependent oxidoreductase [Nocardia carnea]
MTRSRATATHWGNYLIDTAADGKLSVTPHGDDPHPSPIGRSLTALHDPAHRIARPAVRLGYYRDRAAADPTLRGREPFVEVEWDEALDIAADALRTARATGGNRAVYGGSYGWAGAGRFHHAQGQIHRFLQLFGGYTASVDTYSFAAAEVLIPHILGMNAYDAARQAPSTGEIVRNCARIVFFGGAAQRNAQVNPGGIGAHPGPGRLTALRDAGIDIVHIGPVRDDCDPAAARWIPCRPHSDSAIMFALLHTLVTEGLHDRAFLDRYCTGFDRLSDYVTGRTDGIPKSPEWAAEIAEIPAAEIRALARSMARERCLIGLPYSLQRAEHGEQSYWAAWALAAALGHIGLPGGGVLMGTGVGMTNNMQRRYLPFEIGALPQPGNPVADRVPVARLTEMLERPGGTVDYNGRVLTYPPIDLIYWAGGNPFHHHQDLNRLRRAWARPHTVIVNEISWTATARLADIVLPSTASAEREDFAGGRNDHWLAPMRQALEPYGQARDDYAIFAGLAERLGFAERFTEGRTARQWVEQLWRTTVDNAAAAGIRLPDYADFRAGGPLDLRPQLPESRHALEQFRDDPERYPLRTPSGRIELFSRTIADFRYPDCLGHPAWFPPREWLGSPAAQRFPLHLLSHQPATRLHSQLDHGVTSRESKIHGREPVRMNPADAAARGLCDGDIVRIHNDRGALLAGVRISDAVRPGVMHMATGAWYDPLDPADPESLDIHGNPNTVTNDIGTSSLTQGPSANSCLVEAERYEGELPPLSVRTPPPMVAARAGRGLPPPQPPRPSARGNTRGQ